MAARGETAGSKGGQIEINAPSRSVTLTSGAVVDASGRAGGGSIAIGTTMARHKAGPGLAAPTAKSVTIASGARVAAEAMERGRGGDITVLSAGGVTEHRGSISAKGGPEGGDGGYVEVSGSEFVLQGRVDVSAPKGRVGSILLDPNDLLIANPGDAGLLKNNDKSFTSTGGAKITTLSPDDIVTFMTGDITLQTGAGGTLQVSTALNGTVKGSNINSITLLADGQLTINAAVTSKGDITLKNTAGAVDLNASLTSGAGKTVAITTPGSIALAANINTGAAGKVDLNAGGGVKQTAGIITTGTLTSTLGVTGTVDLGTTNNAIGGVGGFKVTGGDFLLRNPTQVLILGTLSVDAGRTVSLGTNQIGITGGAISAPGGTVEIASLNGAQLWLGGNNGTVLTLLQADLDNISSTVLRLGSARTSPVVADILAIAGPIDVTKAATGRLELHAGANNIVVAGAVKANGLDLNSKTGGVTSNAGAVVTAGTLSSSTGVAGAVALDADTHAIKTLGAMKIGGAFALKTSEAVAVTGSVAADTISLISSANAAKAIDVTGGLAVNAGKLMRLETTDGTLGGIAIAGTIDTTTTGTLDLKTAAGGVVQSAGTITAGVLSGTDVTGAVTLAQASNAISGIGTLTATGAISVASKTAMAVTGTVSGLSVALDSSAASAKAIDVSGTIKVVTDTSIALRASNSSGGIALSGVLDGGTAAAIDLSAGTGGITQSGGSVTTPLLRSSFGSGGTIKLTSGANKFSVLGDLVSTNGDVLLVSDAALTVDGALKSAAGGLVSIATDGFTITRGTIDTTGGTVEIAPLTQSMSLGQINGSDLAILSSDLAAISTSVLRLGAATAGGVVADSVVVRDSFDASTAATTRLRIDAGASGITIDKGTLKANGLDLTTTGGGVNGVAGALVEATSLSSSTGITGDVALDNSIHAIGGIGSLTVTGGSLKVRSGVALEVTGPVLADGVTLTGSAALAGAINVTGTLAVTAGKTIALTAAQAGKGGIAISGLVDATGTGTLDLSAGAGGVVQSGGTLIAGTLTSATKSTGTVSLDQAANKVSGIGPFIVNSGNFVLTTGTAVTVSGLLSAGSVTINSSAAASKAIDVTGTIAVTPLAPAGNVVLRASAASGGIALSGVVDATGGSIDLSAGTGGVVQTTGSLLADGLFSSFGSAGSVKLQATGNRIGTLGGFSVSAGSFSMSDALALKVVGPVLASGDITLSTSAAAGLLQVDGTLTSGAGKTISLTASDAAGGIVLAADVNASATGILDLNAGSSGAVQNAGTVTAGTLRSSLGSAGSVKLDQAGNAITGIGDIKVSSGNLVVATGTTLAATGTLEAAAGLVSLTSSATSGTAITVSGAITGNDVTLAATSASKGGIALGGSIATATSGTLDLTAGADGVTQTGGGVVAGRLASTGGLRGTLKLTGTQNNFANLGPLSVSAGDIFLRNDLAPVMTVGGLVTVDNGRTISLTTDGLAVSKGALNAPGGTVELATITRAISLGATNGGDFSLLQADLSFITSDTLRLTGPSVTLRGNLDTTKTVATALVLDVGTGGVALTTGTLSANALDVSVDGAGISQTAGVLAAGTLRSSAGGVVGAVGLDNAANKIATLAGFTVNGGLSLTSAIALAVTGAVSADSIALTSGAAGGGALALANTGTLALTGAGRIGLATTGTSGTIELAGTVNAGTGGTLDLAATGAVTQSGGVVTAGTLSSTAGVAGPVTLEQAGNAIAALGDISVTAGALSVTTTSGLVVAGAVKAGDVTLRSTASAAKAIDVPGSITTLAGGSVVLAAQDVAGGITLSGTLDASSSGRIDLSAGTDGVTQSAGKLSAGRLLSSGGVVGNLVLAQAANALASIGPLAGKGDVTIFNGTALTIVDAVSAGAGRTLSLSTDALSFGGGSLAASGGTVEIGPLGAATSIGLGLAGGNLTLGNLTTVSASLLRIGQASAAGNGAKAASIVLDGKITPVVGTLELISSGTVAQKTGGLEVGTLSATAASLDLGASGNRIGALGALAIDNNLTVANDLALSITGTLSAGSIALRSAAASANALDVSGTLVTTGGGSVALAATNAAGGIALSGTVSTTALDLAAGSAGISQTAGVITAGTLTSGGVSGSVLLGQKANAIGSIGGFKVTGGGFTLADSAAVTVAGALVADSVSITSSAADAKAVAVSGSITSTGSTTLVASDAVGGIALSGDIQASQLDLGAGSGGVVQSGGAVAAGTLVSSTGVAGNVALGSAGNSILALGDFAVSAGSFTLVDGAALNVTGAVSAASVSLTGTSASGQAVAVNGSITSTGTTTLVAGNAAGGIVLAGTVKAGTLDLGAGSGGVTQSGGSVTAASLTSGTGVTGAVALGQAGNAIGAIGDFSVKGAGFTLVDSVAVNVTGALAAKSVSITSSAAVANAVGVSGSITATTTTSLVASNAAGGIALSGVLKSGALDLVAGSGGVSQTGGSITAASLSGSAGGTVALGQTGNAVDAVDAFTVTGGSFTLVDSVALTVSGALVADNVSLTGNAASVAAIAVTGRIGATGTTTLLAADAAGGISLSGTIDTGILDLGARAGVVQPGGTLIVGTLRATGGVTGDLVLDQAGNQVATVGNFIVSNGGRFSLRDSVALTVNGGLAAAAVSLSSSAAVGNALAVSGSITSTGTTALAATDAAGGIALSGVVKAGVLDLAAGSGGVVQSAGSIVVGTLSSAGVGGSVTLGQTGNEVGTLGGFTVTGGSLTLVDSVALAIVGPVVADGVAITGNAASATALSLTGSITTTGTTALVAGNAAGGIALAGDIKAATLDLGAGSGGVSQTGGTITAGTLRSGTGVAGKVALGQAGNAIGTLGGFAVTGGSFSLVDSIALTVAGAVSADAVSLTGAAASAQALSVSGSITSTGTTALVASNAVGGIALSGTISAGVLDLGAGSGGVTQAGGAITANGIVSSGGVAGTVTLASTDNDIRDIGDFTVTGGSFTLQSQFSISVSGALAADAVQLLSNAGITGAINVSGSITSAGTVELAGSAIARSNGGILLSGTITAGTLVLLSDIGGVTQTGGAIIAGTLTGSGFGENADVVLAQAANKIGTLNNYSMAGGTLVLVDSIPLTVTGLANAAGITLINSAASAAAVTVNGVLSATGTVAINASNAAGGIVLAGTVGGAVLDLAAGSGGVTQTGGSITADALVSSTGVAGNVVLDRAGNAIGTLGDFAVSAGDFRLTGASALTVAGSVSATNITLRDSAANPAALDITGALTSASTGTVTLVASNAAGGISMSGTVKAGTLDLSAGSGGVTQLGGSITATTLASTGGIGGAVFLAQPGNAIDKLGAMKVTNGALTLLVSAALDVSGLVVANDITLIGTGASAKAIAVSGGIEASGTAILAAGDPAGGIELSGTIKAAVLDLSAGSAGVTQPGGSITAGKLTSSGGSAGSVTLDRTANAIGTLDGFVVTAGTLSITDSVALTVAGTVSAPDIVLRSAATGAGAINVTGSLTSTTGGLISLVASDASGGIALAGTVNAGVGVVDLSAGAGKVTQTAGAITAGTLRSSAGVASDVALTQAGNAIATLGGFTVTGGTFALTGASALTVAGPLAATDITLRNAAADAKALSVTGSITAGATGVVTLEASDAAGGIALSGTIKGDVVDLSAGSGTITQTGGAITASTLRSTGGVASNVVLGQAANSIAAVAGFSVTGGNFTLADSIALSITGPLVAGDITLTGAAASAKAIAVTGSLTAGGTARLTASNAAGGIELAGAVKADVLDLTAGSGTVTQTGGAITAARLTSSGGVASDVTLNQAGNAIGAIDAFAVTGGGFALTDSTALTVAGPLRAARVTLRGSAADAKAIAVTGTITADAGGTIALAASDAAGGIALSGRVDATATGTLDLAAGAGVSQTGGAIIAGTLASANGVAGNVVLSQAGNQVTRIGGFTVTGGGFTLRDSVALTVAGPLVADTIALTGSATGATALAVTGSLDAKGTATLTASDTAGGITLSGAVKAATLDLAAGSAGIVQPAGSITATTLTSTAGVTGKVALEQAGNAIGTLGAFKVTNADFALTDSIALKVAGPVSAANITLRDSAVGAAALEVTGALTANPGGTIALVASNPAGGIALSGAISAGATGIVDLSAGSFTVTQSGGSITAGTLRSTGGVASSVTLGQAGNAIGSVGNFTVTGGSFTLVDSLALTVSGALVADAVSLTGSAASANAITVGGSITTSGTTALVASNASGGIVLSGTVKAGVLDLTAGSGTVSQTGGSVTAGTLRSTGGVASNVVLTSTANAIDAIGDFKLTGGSLTLVDSVAFAVSGALVADAVKLTGSAAAANAVAVSGSIATTGTTALVASNAAGGIALSGSISAGALDLAAGTGGVAQSAGVITTQTLLSTGGIAGTVALSQAGNAVASIGNLTVTGAGFTLVDSVALTVTGTLRADTIVLTDSAASPTALTVAGALVGQLGGIRLTASDTAGGIRLSGTLDTGSASLDLVAGAGGVVQSAGAITATVLKSSGNVAGDVTLEQGGNKIGRIDEFNVTNGNFSLVDSIALISLGLNANNVTLRSTATGEGALVVVGFLSTAPGGTVTLRATSGGIRLGELSGTGRADIDVSATGTLDIGTATGVVQTAGQIVAGTLLASAGTTGSVTLNQAANAIGAIGNLTVSAGDFALSDSIALAVSGPLRANNITLRSSAVGAQAINVTGAASTTLGGTITLAATDAAGGISLGGTVNATATGVVDLSAGSAGVTQTGGTLIAGTMRSSGGIGGNVQLAQPGNEVGSIGDLAVTGGDFTLADSIALTVTGVLSANNLRITDSAAGSKAIQVTGTVRSATDGAIDLVASAPTGGITLSGTLDAPGNGRVDLSAGSGGVSQTAGQIIAGLLQSTGNVVGKVNLAQAGNAIGTLGGFAVTGGSFTLASATALNIAGALVADAAFITGSAASASAVTLSGSVTTTGTTSLRASDPAGGIVLAGTAKAATLDLSAGSAGISQTGGALRVATLRSGFGVGGTVSLNQTANEVAAIGGFNVTAGNFSLVNSTALTISGGLLVSQGGISLTGAAGVTGAITVTGQVTGGSGRNVALTASNGGLVIADTGLVAAPSGLLTLSAQTGMSGKGTIQAGKLSVSNAQAGDVVLTGNGANAIGTLVGVNIADGGFLFDNATSLAITGPLSARLLGVTATGLLSVANGVSITTLGLDRGTQGVNDKLSATQIASLTTDKLGSFLAVRSANNAPAQLQIGTISVTPFGGGNKATLDLVLPSPQAGAITIENLNAPALDLIVVARAGGTAIGTVDIASLLVLGSGGKVDLFGQVGGLAGQAAANKAGIFSNPDSNYRINACPITSVNCVLLPVQTVPPTSPLRDLPIVRDRPTQDDTDVQLPNVSDEDY